MLETCPFTACLSVCACFTLGVNQSVATYFTAPHLQSNGVIINTSFLKSYIDNFLCELDKDLPRQLPPRLCGVILVKSPYMPISSCPPKRLFRQERLSVYLFRHQLIEETIICQRTLLKELIQ